MENASVGFILSDTFVVSILQLNYLTGTNRSVDLYSFMS